MIDLAGLNLPSGIALYQRSECHRRRMMIQSAVNGRIADALVIVCETLQSRHVARVFTVVTSIPLVLEFGRYRIYQ